MRISKSTIIFLTFVLMFSIFVANVANLISVDLAYTNYSDDLEAQNVENDLMFIKMTDQPSHLMWFLQISDLHISIFHDLGRTTDLRDFCEKTIPAFQPSVVLASGDLTDAKAKDNIGSQQFKQEWEIYKNILDQCRVNQKTRWLDIRGNHDNFNVAGPESKENFYVNYSQQGQKNPRSYKHQIEVGGEKYSFIAVDACLEPGPRRPFNFVGVLTKNETEHVIQLAENARKEGSNYTIWFGHYPTSCIIASQEAGPGGVRSLIGYYREGPIYLCGHFHKLGGIVPNMYTLQQAGFLELELGDWKDNRVFRLIAMDHGLVSFLDIEHKDWPVALVTNPKHALYVIPYRENLEIIRHSTHIRLLAFSTCNLATVQIKINDEEWQPCDNVEGPLYVAAWEPTKYLTGLHKIEVYVKDEYGREKLTSQPFSLDGTRMSFGVLARIALMSNVSRLCMFGVMLGICVIPLCLLRYIHRCFKKKNSTNAIPYRRGFFVGNWIRKLWILSAVDRVFYPLVIYALYLSVGPWSVGYIIEDYAGVIFAWGIFCNGSFLPGSFTYAYGFLQMISFQMPLTFILAHRCDKRLHYHMTGGQRWNPWWKEVIHNLPFIITITLQMLFAYFFWLAYGTMAFLLGPLRTWSIVLAACLWHHTDRLPKECMREAILVWGPKYTSIDK